MSRILEEIYGTAEEMFNAGIIPVKTMKEFDKLCLPKVHELKPEEIKKIREKANVSQSVFAAYLNTSVSSVKKWETGEKKPGNIALKMLNLVEARGLKILA